jgi:1-phosphofructokinase family hexose kinase
MILAINANAAIDWVFFIDEFVPGGVMRPSHAVLSVGGKSLDAAVVLKTLGAPVQAVSFAAGQNGKTLAALLAGKEIPSDLIWLEGDTRVSYVIAETRLNRHSHITTSGYTVSETDCAVFVERALQHAAGADWAILAGSLPGGAPQAFYGDLTRLLHEKNVKVLIDVSGQPALEAIPAQPDILKMNQAEFLRTFSDQAGEWSPSELQSAERAGWVKAVRQVMRACAIEIFVLTCGEDGILAFTPQGDFHASGPLLPAVNAAGSGDAVSAALAFRLSLGDSWEEALRWAAATGSAVVVTEGTAECHLADINRFYPETSVTALD